MEAVRCESCGLKALVAASTCPHCGHFLDIRNSFGELLPLVYCTTCDVSYPARDGACRWCGSKPEKVNIRPHIWKGVGALVFIGMATAAFLTRDRPDASPGRSTVSDSGATLVNAPAPAVGDQRGVVTAAPIDSGATLGAATPGAAITDTLAPRVAVSDSLPAVRTLVMDTAQQVLATSPLASDNAPAALSAPAPDNAALAPSPPPEPPRAVVAESKPKAVAPPRKAAARTPPPRRAVGWSNAVARSWVTVRAAPSRSARLLGSVGPDTHVQIGEVRGDWRRIRLRGMSGWVERGRFAPRRVASTSRRTAPY